MNKINSKPLPIKPAIIKAYDIRGRYPQELNEETAWQFGAALATYLSAQTIAVGYDARLSSPALASAALAGIRSTGATAINLGICSSDALYFAVGHYGYDGGLMITASHNPAIYNGLKFCRQQAIPLSRQNGLLEMQKLIETKKLKTASRGRCQKKNIEQVYSNYILSFVQKKQLRRLKIVIDAGNGVAGLTLKHLAKKLPLKIIPLNWQPDGRFPAHQPDPTLAKNTKQLRQLVKKEQADFGAAFDGDADRLVLIDETGRQLSGSEVMLLIIKKILAENTRQTILYNAVCSRAVPELIKALGGRGLRTPVGHSLIKPLMRRYQAVFGGEDSGHYYWRDNYFADSGFLALVNILMVLSQDRRPLSEIIRGLNPYQQKDLAIPTTHTATIIKNFAKIFKSEKIDYLDGLTVNYPDWWFNLRPSNTEPLLRLTIEAKNKQQLEQRQNQLQKLLKKYL